MRNHPPEHAFYYDFLLGGYRQPWHAPSNVKTARSTCRAAIRRGVKNSTARGTAGIIWAGAALARDTTAPCRRATDAVLAEHRRDFRPSFQNSSTTGRPRLPSHGPGCSTP